MAGSGAFTAIATTGRFGDLRRLPMLGAVLRSNFALYFGVSLAALAADLLIFALLTDGLGLRPGVAATIAWVIGLAVHYHLARALLYTAMPRRGTVVDGVRRFISYGVPSLAGLALTVAVVELGVWLGLAPIMARAIAAVLSFALAFVMRNLMFARKPSGRDPGRVAFEAAAISG